MATPAFIVESFTANHKCLDQSARRQGGGDLRKVGIVTVIGLPIKRDPSQPDHHEQYQRRHDNPVKARILHSKAEGCDGQHGEKQRNAVGNITDGKHSWRYDHDEDSGDKQRRPCGRCDEGAAAVQQQDQYCQRCQ